MAQNVYMMPVHTHQLHKRLSRYNCFFPDWLVLRHLSMNFSYIQVRKKILSSMNNTYEELISVSIRLRRSKMLEIEGIWHERSQ